MSPLCAALIYTHCTAAKKNGMLPHPPQESKNLRRFLYLLQLLASATMTIHIMVFNIVFKVLR